MLEFKAKYNDSYPGQVPALATFASGSGSHNSKGNQLPALRLLRSYGRLVQALGRHYTSTVLLAKQLKSLYKTLETYQDYRMFYDLTSAALASRANPGNLPLPQRVSLPERLTRSILRKSTRVVFVYNKRAELHIQQLDAPVYKKGNLFEKTDEKNAWQSRCKQYAMLA